MEKPFWPACERNRDPILFTLEEIIKQRPARILEVGSGSGQHADHFTAAHSDWYWQCTDQHEYLAGIGMWQRDAQRENFPPALELDVLQPAQWEQVTQPWDWVYSANALHIMHWATVEAFFERLASLVELGAGLLVYGPFNRDGAFTSDSNAAFDQSLKARDPLMGIRDLEAVENLARDIGLNLQQVRKMPANNFLLEFSPQPHS